MTSSVSFNSCSMGTLTVYAAQDTLTEELKTAFQEEVLTGEENVETEAPEEEAARETAEESIYKEEPKAEGAVPEAVVETVSSEVNSFGLEEQEYQVLLKIVEAEAGGEDMKSRILVANVILNRVKDHHFPDTVSEVVWERNNGATQFSPTEDGRISTVEISEMTKEAVRQVLEGLDYSKGALFFVAKDQALESNVDWFESDLKLLFEHGDHAFYTFP